MNKNLQQEKDFLLLIESHKRVIYKVCYMYATDDELLNDLYQEIVMNLWRAYPSFRGESSPATWIYRISLNTCISYRRKSKHQIQAVTLPVNFEAFAEDDGKKSSQLRELYRLIHALNPLERALILLWLEERSYDEIARIVGISKNNVGVRLNRIREKLKNQWNLLSEQLKKNEIINHEAIKRMIEKRTLSARDRLIGANVIAVFVLTGMLFLFPLAATRVIIRQELLWMFYIVFPLLILYSLWNIHVLYKFNLATRTLLELHRWILSYKRRLRIEIWCTPFLTLGLFISVFLIHHHYRNLLMVVFLS